MLCNFSSLSYKLTFNTKINFWSPNLNRCRNSSNCFVMFTVLPVEETEILLKMAGCGSECVSVLALHLKFWNPDVESESCCLVKMWRYLHLNWCFLTPQNPRELPCQGQHHSDNSGKQFHEVRDVQNKSLTRHEWTVGAQDTRQKLKSWLATRRILRWVLVMFIDDIQSNKHFKIILIHKGTLNYLKILMAMEELVVLDVLDGHLYFSIT